MAGRLYLLDTNILIALINGKEHGRAIDAAYGLRASKMRPLACIVSHGELWAMARVNKLGEPKRTAIAEMLDHGIVTVDLGDAAVLKGYADVYEALRNDPQGSRANMGQNDMWIAAATRAAGATLLTMDTDFDPLCPATIDRIYIPKHGRTGPPSPPT